MSLAPFNPLHVPSVLRPVTVIERPTQSLSDTFGWIESLALVMVPFGYCFPFAAIQGLVDVLDQAYGNKIFVSSPPLCLSADISGRSGSMFASSCRACHWQCFRTRTICALTLPSAVWSPSRYHFLSFATADSLVMLSLVQVRMVIFSGLLVAVCAMLTSERSEPAILVSSALIGICCWGANGTCVQLVQMLGATSTVLMQSGMQAACLSALVLVLAMQIHSRELESEKVLPPSQYSSLVALRHHLYPSPDALNPC